MSERRTIRKGRTTAVTGLFVALGLLTLGLFGRSLLVGGPPPPPHQETSVSARSEAPNARFEAPVAEGARPGGDAAPIPALEMPPTPEEEAIAREGEDVSPAPPTRPGASRRPSGEARTDGSSPSPASAWIAAGAQGIQPDSIASSGPAPTRIDIPLIGVSAAVDPMGLNSDETMEVPTDFARAGYYTGHPTPGEVGPAILVGHVDNRRGPAVFYRLRELQPGAEVTVERGDGSRVVFLVERSKQVSKDSFPTDEVYGPTPEPTLRLITCGGSFDRSTGHYRDNVIVFLRMKG